jgi:acyl carrier protein
VTRNDFLKLIDDILEQEPGTLQGPEVLADNGWDSLSALVFVSMAGEKFGRVISAGDLLQCETVDDLAGLLGDLVTP